MTPLVWRKKRYSSTTSMLEGGREQGGKSPFSLLSEPISLSSLLFWANFSLLPKRLRFFFSLLPTFSLISPSSQLFLGHFSLLPILFLPLLCYATVYSGFPPLHRKPAKCFKGACPCLFRIAPCLRFDRKLFRVKKGKVGDLPNFCTFRLASL